MEGSLKGKTSNHRGHRGTRRKALACRIRSLELILPGLSHSSLTVTLPFISDPIELRVEAPEPWRLPWRCFPCVPLCPLWLWVFSLPPIPIDHSSNAILQMGNVEVDQQSYVFTAESQVRQQLRFVYGVNRLHAFHLHNYQAFDE